MTSAVRDAIVIEGEGEGEGEGEVDVDDVDDANDANDANDADDADGADDADVARRKPGASRARAPPPARTVPFGRRRQPPARLPGVARTGAFASNFARCVEKKVRTLRTFDACVNSRRANSSYAAMSARSATMTKSGPGDTR
ncbi:Uncharacterised protein [Burkholderia pseudomallei]|nr:Uncharacterised protein [Burkholderia pseudomallei]CAJ8790156.1 Uncharacterised protein [Burkholderia pseudomallei]VBT74390.1 Uncharacterised protein [Burkholderia pseudomallei]